MLKLNKLMEVKRERSCEGHWNWKVINMAATCAKSTPMPSAARLMRLLLSHTPRSMQEMMPTMKRRMKIQDMLGHVTQSRDRR